MSPDVSLVQDVSLGEVNKHYRFYHCPIRTEARCTGALRVFRHERHARKFWLAKLDRKNQQQLAAPAASTHQW